MDGDTNPAWVDLQCNVIRHEIAWREGLLVASIEVFGRAVDELRSFWDGLDDDEGVEL
jgi:hypothetical protein